MDFPRIIHCPNCTHRHSPEPEGFTYTAIATARVTATLDDSAEVLDYYNPEIDPAEGYRDVRCDYCGESIKDLGAGQLGHDRYQHAEWAEPTRLKVRADVNMEVSPTTVGRDAAAHTALVQAAEERGLALTTAADPTGAYVEGHVTGAASDVVPLLAALALSGHAYEAEIDTDDDAVMDRVCRDAGGGIAEMKYEVFHDPSMR